MRWPKFLLQKYPWWNPFHRSGWSHYISFLYLELYYWLLDSWIWGNSSRISSFEGSEWDFSCTSDFTIIISIYGVVLSLHSSLTHLVIVKHFPLSIFFFLSLITSNERFWILNFIRWKPKASYKDGVSGLFKKYPLESYCDIWSLRNGDPFHFSSE